MIWYRSQVSLRQIPDGTSKVYLFGEKYMDQFSHYNTRATSGNGDEESLYVGIADDTIRLGASGGVYTPTDAACPVRTAQPTCNSDQQQFRFPPMQDSPIWPGLQHVNALAPAGVVRKTDYNTFRFGSAHAGGFNMAFCDGSVHSIIYEIDPTVHAMLSDRQDGQTVDASQYLGN